VNETHPADTAPTMTSSNSNAPDDWLACRAKSSPTVRIFAAHILRLRLPPLVRDHAGGQLAVFIKQNMLEK
jgi:hypothetical protein